MAFVRTKAAACGVRLYVLLYEGVYLSILLTALLFQRPWHV